MCGVCHREMIALYNNEQTDQCATAQRTSFDYSIIRPFDLCPDISFTALILNQYY